MYYIRYLTAAVISVVALTVMLMAIPAGIYGGWMLASIEFALHAHLTMSVVLFLIGSVGYTLGIFIVALLLSMIGTSLVGGKKGI